MLCSPRNQLWSPVFWKEIMKNLRSHIRSVQLLENKAAEKVAMRLMLLDERRLFGKDSDKEIEAFLKRAAIDIFAEMIQAAKLGRQLNKEIAT